VDIKSLIDIHKASISSTILRAAETCRNEAELQSEFTIALATIIKASGVAVTRRHEYTLATGRADAAYNRFLIEYEAPGSMRSDLAHSRTKHAVDQVKRYLTDLEIELGVEGSRLAGVATDGTVFIFVRRVNNEFYVDEPLPTTPNTVALFLRYLFSLSSGTALIADNLVQDFGLQSAHARDICRELYIQLSNTSDPLVLKLFEQWRVFYAEVTGYDSKSQRLAKKREFQIFVGSLGIGEANTTADVARVFFALHTYYAILIKFIAWLSASRLLLIRKAPPLAAIAAADDTSFQDKIGKLEKGGLFRDFGIRNFMEADFFGWYVQSFSAELTRALRALLNRLSDYDPMTADVAPEQAQDLLKQLYHYLMPRELRHDLGEYYTPDWLAEYLLNKVEYRGEQTTRLLDPACGSGTFLVLALKRLKAECVGNQVSERKTLALCLRNVVGIDLNPLAVMATRVNYLIALGSLLEYAQEEIDLPVYLADSVLTPSRERELFTRHSYTVRTVVGSFSFPAAYSDARQIEVITKYLDEMVTEEMPVDAFIKRVLATKEMEHPQMDADEEQQSKAILRKLFADLAERHGEGLDGVWARIIKNAFMPLYIGEFDLVVGNPPWVFWNSLPERYRETVRDVMTDTYAIMAPSASTMKQLGSAGKDLSMLFVYVAIDKYLKPAGKLGFVITQTVFQSTAGNEFRRFQLPDARQFAVTSVDDLVAIVPFSTATNKTACAVFEAGRKQAYPVPYTVWRLLATFDRDHADLKEVLAVTSRDDRLAEPNDGKTGFWRILGASDVSNAGGIEGYTARLGVETKLESAFRVTVVRRLMSKGTFAVAADQHRAKVEIPAITGQIEEELLFPYISGESISAFSASRAGIYIVPHDPTVGMQALSLSEMKAQYPKALAYFSQVRSQLENRSLHQRWGTRGTPFYSMYDIGPYTFAPIKLVWKRTTRNFQAAVVRELPVADGYKKTVIPNGKCMLIPFTDPKHAHFVCGLINSSPARYAINGSISSEAHREILNVISIPNYDAQNAIHRHISDLSFEAHKLKDSGEAIRAATVPLDTAVATLWGLSAADLASQRSGVPELT